MTKWLCSRPVAVMGGDRSSIYTLQFTSLPQIPPTPSVCRCLHTQALPHQPGPNLCPRPVSPSPPPPCFCPPPRAAAAAAAPTPQAVRCLSRCWPRCGQSLSSGTPLTCACLVRGGGGEGGCCVVGRLGGSGGVLLLEAFTGTHSEVATSCGQLQQNTAHTHVAAAVHTRLLLLLLEALGAAAAAGGTANIAYTAAVCHPHCVCAVAILPSPPSPPPPFHTPQART